MVKAMVIITQAACGHQDRLSHPLDSSTVVSYMSEVTKTLVICPTVTHIFQLSERTWQSSALLGGPCFIICGPIIGEHSFHIQCLSFFSSCCDEITLTNQLKRERVYSGLQFEAVFHHSGEYMASGQGLGNSRRLACHTILSVRNQRKNSKQDLAIKPQGLPLVFYFLQQAPPSKGSTMSQKQQANWRPHVQIHEPVRDVSH